MERYYQFGGMDFVLDLPDGRMASDEKWLAAFRVSGVIDPHIYRFCIVSELTPPRGIKVQSTPRTTIYRDGDTTLCYSELVGNASDPRTFCIVSCGREHRGTPGTPGSCGRKHREHRGSFSRKEKRNPYPNGSLPILFDRKIPSCPTADTTV